MDGWRYFPIMSLLANGSSPMLKHTHTYAWREKGAKQDRDMASVLRSVGEGRTWGNRPNNEGIDCPMRYTDARETDFARHNGELEEDDASRELRARLARGGAGEGGSTTTLPAATHNEFSEWIRLSNEGDKGMIYGVDHDQMVRARPCKSKTRYFAPQAHPLVALGRNHLRDDEIGRVRRSVPGALGDKIEEYNATRKFSGF
ncbi:hypothetical protein IW262DRAFT_1291443 [Armillaria fumosa]|nr:hypothetical protein IW262DRAFT_1291443 [Armillaria fumosa]